MKYDYVVKKYGKYYKAGEDVPDEEVELDKNELPFSDSDIELESMPAKRGRPKKEDI